MKKIFLNRLFYPQKLLNNHCHWVAIKISILITTVKFMNKPDILEKEPKPIYMSLWVLKYHWINKLHNQPNEALSVENLIKLRMNCLIIKLRKVNSRRHWVNKRVLKVVSVKLINQLIPRIKKLLSIKISNFQWILINLSII